MSDDLVKRLRAMLEGDMRPSPLGERAADRIEELEDKLAKAVKLMEVSVEVAGWELDLDLRDEVIEFFTELTGGKDD